MSQIITKFIKNAAVNLTTKVTGLLPIANGGTGAGTQSAGFDALSPMTTAGDVIYGGTAGTGTRLAVGSEGQFLKVASGIPSWSNPATGKINYILNPNAIANTTGWAAYADAAGTTPVDGTGGAPTVTITRDTGSLVVGTTSLLITKDAANRQGEGVSYAFTIDTALKSQPITISCYIAASANFVFGTPTGSTASDIQVYIYDVTNAVLITPYPATISGNGLFQAQFQSTTSTSYRLIYHVGTTSALSYTVAMGEVAVSPSESSFIPLSSDLGTSSTITLTSSAASPVVKGTMSTDKIAYARDGQFAIMYVEFDQTGASGSGAQSGTYGYRLSMPTGLKIDTTITNVNTSTNTSTAQSIGVLFSEFGGGNTGGSQMTEGRAVAYDEDTFRIVGTFGGTIGIWGLQNPLSSASVRISGWVRVPIKGWTTGFVSSAVVGQNIPENLRASKSATQALTTGSTTKIVWQTVTHDSAGGWDSTNNRYVVKTAGKFKVTSQLQFATNGTSFRDIHVRKNGTSIYINQSAGASSGAFDLIQAISTPDIDMVAGDYFEIFATQSSGGNLNIINGSYTFFGVTKTENPQAYINIRRVAKISDEKANTTAGGSSTSGSYATRTLNTLVDPFGFTSLASNQFVLQPGTYRIRALVPAYGSNQHKAKLRNITASSDTIIGSSCHAGTAAQTDSIVAGVFSITVATTFEIQHRVTTSVATNGLGQPASFSDVEVYTQVEIEKLL